MMRPTKRTIGLAWSVMAAWIGSGAPAAAQGWEGRGFLSVDGSYQASATEFASDATFTLYTEGGSLDTTYKIKAGPVINVRGGVRVWRNLALGAGVTQFNRTHTATVAARLPHPFFFGRLRDASGDAGDLTREETGVHLEVTWLVPLGDKLDLSVFGGPSYIQIKQDLVRQVTYSESYPYDTATFGGADRSSGTKANVGFNVGGDVTYLFTKRIGVGGFVRLTRASIQLQPVQIAPDTGTVDKVDAGGAQVGGGLRVRF